MLDKQTSEDAITTIQDQYLSFKLYQEYFAFPVALIREVIEKSSYTTIPRTIGYMRGIFNLRGAVIPIIDLRILFKLNKPADYETKVLSDIIILEIPNSENNAMIGILTDQIEEVLNLPKTLTNIDHDLTENNFILKIGKKDGFFILILDIQKIISYIDKELILLSSNE